MVGAVSDVNGSTSDGFHTFDELYAHRMTLTMALFRALNGSGLAIGAGVYVVRRQREQADQVRLVAD